MRHAAFDRAVRVQGGIVDTVRWRLLSLGTAVLVVAAVLFPVRPARAGVQDVIGTCQFQGATVEGIAVSVPPAARQVAIVCTVYEHGVARGGCGLVLPAPAATCAGPTGVVLGPPTVCTYAWAVFPSGTAYDEHCDPSRQD